MTKPQLKALRTIAEEHKSSPFSADVSAIYQLPGRMVDKYRVAASLLDKGFITRKGDYLYITDAGRRALDGEG